MWDRMRAGVALLVFILLAGGLSAGEPRRLTMDGRFKQCPTFVDGGAAIVFNVQEKRTLNALVKLDLKTGKQSRLHPNENRNEFEVAFSGDGRYLSFVQNQSNLGLKLLIRDTEEKKTAVFNPGGGFYGIRAPQFTPDSKRVLFSYPIEGGQQIASINLKGEDRKLLTRGTAINNWPRISADGKRVYFSSSREGNYEITVMDITGDNLRRLTNNPRMDIRPALSPAGSHIAFTSARDSNYEIYVMQTDGSAVRRITNNPERDDYAVWHPNGKQLCLVSERDGQHDLYLIDVDR